MNHRSDPKQDLKFEYPEESLEPRHIAPVIAFAFAAFRPQVHPGAHGARRPHPDHDVGYAPEPEALVGGFDAQIPFVGVYNRPAQSLGDFEAAPENLLR